MLTAMSIETRFDIAFIAAMARREKQIQQNYRPIIAVHKWFARRPGTLFRGLTLAEFGDGPLSETFFAANDFSGRTIADPFMGGGTPLLEANRVGCDVLGVDINPMAAWVVREEIEHLDPAAYRRAADALVRELTDEIGDAYVTDCPICSTRGSFSAWNSAPATSPRSPINGSAVLSPRTSPTCSGTRTCCAGTTRPP